MSEDDADVGCMFTIVAVVATAIVSSVVSCEAGKEMGAIGVTDGTHVVVTLPDGRRELCEAKKETKP